MLMIVLLVVMYNYPVLMPYLSTPPSFSIQICADAQVALSFAIANSFFSLLADGGGGRIPDRNAAKTKKGLGRDPCCSLRPPTHQKASHSSQRSHPTEWELCCTLMQSSHCCIGFLGCSLHTPLRGAAHCSSRVLVLPAPFSIKPNKK